MIVGMSIAGGDEMSEMSTVDHVTCAVVAC